MNICIRMPNGRNVVVPDGLLSVERDGRVTDVYAGRLLPGDKILVSRAVLAMRGDGRPRDAVG